MTGTKRLALLLAAIVLAAGPAAADAVSDRVAAAKSRCLIGETVTGFLEAVQGENPSAADLAAMREINIKRRAVYARLARQQNVALEVVAQLTGERQVNSASAGECVRGGASWTRR